MVHKARKGVMEFLLINHPLDCPICDQGGECDLQDQAMAYGFDRSRYHENKRAVTDKELRPAGQDLDDPLHPLHALHPLRRPKSPASRSWARPAAARTWRSRPMSSRRSTSELSGNVIDLCPVGALTSKPYAFEARPWELRRPSRSTCWTRSARNIRVDARGARGDARAAARSTTTSTRSGSPTSRATPSTGCGGSGSTGPMSATTASCEPATWDEAFDADRRAAARARRRADRGDRRRPLRCRDRCWRSRS